MRGSIDLTVSRAGINVRIRDTTHQYFLQTNLEDRGIPSQDGQFQQSRNMQSSSSQQSCYYSPSHHTSSSKQCHTEITIENNNNNKNEEDTKLQSTGSFQKGNVNIHSRKYKKYNNRISQSEDLVNTYFQDPNQNDASEDGPSGSEKSLSSSDYDADDDDDIYTERNKLILSEKQKFKSLCDLKKTTEMNSEEKLKNFNKFLKEHNRSSSDHTLAQNIYGMNGDMNQKRKLCRINNNRKILRQRHKRDCETSPQLALLFPMMSHGDCEVEDFPQKLKRCLNKSCHKRGQFLKKNCNKATFLAESYEPEYKLKTLEDLYGPDSNLPGISDDKFSNHYSKFIYRPEKNTRNNGNFIKKHPKLSVLSSYDKTESDNIHFQDDQRDHDYTSETSLQKHLEQQFKQWLKEHWGRGILKKSQQHKFTTSKEHQNTREGIPKKLMYNQPMYFLNKIRNQESDTPVVSTKMYVKNNEHKYFPISTESEEKPTEINRNQEDNYTFENGKYELPEPSLTFSSLSSSKEQETRNKLKHGNDKIDNIPLHSDTECERMGTYYSSCNTFQPINFKQESPKKTYNEQEQEEDSKLEDKRTSYSSSQKSGLPRLSYANFLKHFPPYKMINNRSTSLKTPEPFQSEPASYQITTKTSKMENPSILQQLNLNEIYQKLPSNFELSAGQWIHLQPSDGLHIHSHKTNPNHRPENERELENNLLQYNMNSRSSSAPNNVTDVETKDDISETFPTEFNNNGGFHRLKSVPESDHMYMPFIINKTENVLGDILNNPANAKQDFYNPESQVQSHDDTFDNSTSDVPHTSQENVPHQAIGKINNNMHGNNNTQPFAGNKEETVTEINLSIQIGKNITQDGREDNASTQKTHESKPIKQNSKLTHPSTLLEESGNAEEKDLQNNAVNIQYTNKSNIYPSKFPSESQVSPDQNKEKPSNSTSESIIDLLNAMLESQKEAPMIDTTARYPSERILTSITDISLTPTERNSFDFLDSGADDLQGSIQEENVIKDITSVPKAETQNNEDNRNIPQIYPILEVNHQSYPEQIYKKDVSPTTTTDHQIFTSEHYELSKADDDSEKIPLLKNTPQFNEFEYPTNNLPKFPHSTEATVHGPPEYSGTMLIIDPSTGAVTETIPVTGRLLMLSSKQGNDVPNNDDSNPLNQPYSHSSNEQGKYTPPPYTAVIGNDFLYTIYPQENHNENIHFPQNVIHSAPETPFRRNEQNEFETPEKTDHSTETEDTTNNFKGKVDTNSNDNYTTQIIPTTSPISWFEKDYNNISIPKERTSGIHSSSDPERQIGTEDDQVSLSISPDVHVTCYKKDSHCEVAKNDVYSNFFTVMLQEMQKLGKENCSETCTGSKLIPACELCVKKLIEEKVSDEEIKSFAAQHCPKQEGIEDGSDILVDKNSPAYAKCKYKFIADLTSFFSLWLKSITNSH